MQLLRILVVSMSSAFLHAVKQALQCKPRVAEVWEAQTGQIAVAQAKACRPDLVLLDERLRDMSLLEIVSKLRTQLLSSLIVMMTMYEVDSYQDALSEIGVDQVIDKTRFTEEIETLLATMP